MIDLPNNFALSKLAKKHKNEQNVMLDVNSVL